MADRDHDHRRHGEPSGYRGQGGGHYGEDFGRRLRQGEPTYGAEDVSEGARRSKWREDQRYDDTGWTARRSFRDEEPRPEDRYGEGRRDWTRFERDTGGGGYGQYGAGGFARGGYGQSGYGGDYGQRQHGQSTFGGEGRARFGESDGERGLRSDDREFEPDYLDWRNERLAGYDRDYAQWRADQSRRHDDEYRTWRGERKGVFHRTFEDWRRSRELERRTDELRTDDKVQDVTEGRDPFKVRLPDDDDRDRGDLRTRSSGDDLAAGHNPALERQAEGRGGERDFPPLPRRDDEDRARAAYRGSDDALPPGENPSVGKVAEGEDAGLLASLKRPDDESDEDFNRRMEAARAADAGASADGDLGITGNPTLDKLTGGRKT